jgi:phosphate starvation-inducible membrane PsiE
MRGANPYLDIRIQRSGERAGENRKTMSQILIRFLVGGFVVSAFALIGDLLRPKSFAGLFGAAPSVALATLSLTVASMGSFYADKEARSMVAGAIAFFVYASFVSWIVMRYKPKALWATTGSIPLWFCVAVGLWYVWLE